MIGRMRVRVHRDHLHVELDPAARVLGLAASFVVPWSTLREVEVVRSEMPDLLDHWLRGLHVPGWAARGRFLAWDGTRRFLWLERARPWALRMRLEGHDAYDELLLGVRDPEALQDAIEKARRSG